MLVPSQLREHSPRRWSYLTCLWSLFLTCAAVTVSRADSEVPPKDGTLRASKESKAEREVELRPCSFQNVTPGETRADDAIKRLGTPAEDSAAGGIRTLTYHLEPFEKVELAVIDGTVASVVLHFKSPASPTQVEHELQLKGIESAEVTSESGQLLGRAYPERGVMLNFDPESKSHRATHLVLEPVSAELFLLRVQSDLRHHYERSLADLRIAKRMDGANAEMLLLLTRCQGQAGQCRQALDTVSQALEAAPGDTRLTLHKAELLLRLDRADEALDLIKGVVDGRPQEVELHAWAEKLFGDVLAQGADRDFARAIEHHLASIKLAAPLANEKNAPVRRRAKELLVDAFLAAAFDIAAGEWQEKQTTTGKWLTSARELASATIAQDQGDELLRLRLTLASLAVQAEFGTSESLDQLTSALNRDVQQLSEASSDGLFQRELQLLRVRGLFDAATIAHRRDRSTQARELAKQAVAIFEPLADSRELLPFERYMVGRLYFFLGSSAAVVDNDHNEAVKWYTKARKFLSEDPPAFAASEIGRHGERFVSMGASYFEAGQHDLGLRLTRDGLEAMKEAAENGFIDAKSLALPYSNLAAMYKLVGKSEEARQYSEFASRLSAGQTTKR